MLSKKFLHVHIVIWILFLISIIVAVGFPNLDLLVSSYFYEDGRFTYKNTPLEYFFHKSVRPFVIIIALVSIGIFTYNRVKDKNVWGLTKKKFLYIFLVLALAPGLIVNIFLKEGLERPRPKQVIEFGGKKEFYPAYTYTNQGKDSFSSGHVAAAVSLMGIAMLARKRRNFWIGLTFVYSLGMMHARVAAGGHFLSDVVASLFIVYIANQILYEKLIASEEEPCES